MNRLFVIVLAVIISAAWIYDQHKHRQYHERQERWHLEKDCPCRKNNLAIDENGVLG